jgi:hypothetical protein
MDNLTRTQLKEKYKELLYTFGKECMVEQIGENYVPQAIRKTLPGYKEEEDKLYLYKYQYLVKGYNIRYLKNLTEEEEAKVVDTMARRKELILWEKCKQRKKKLDLER